jgi:hypothetical protein
MVMSIAELVRKAAAGTIGTGDFIAASGLLAAEQSNQFLDQVYDVDDFSRLHRSERRRSKSGTIAKIGIANRILRRKTAGVDDATLVRPDYGGVAYQTIATRVDTEMENEVLEENIEGEGFEDHWLRLITDQVGRDLVDLHFNGDSTSADPFLSINDGWLYQLANDGLANRVNGAAINSGNLEKDHWQAALEAMPDKYKRAGRLRWIINETNLGRWVDYLTNRSTAAGDAALVNGDVAKIRSIPPTIVNSLPNDRILLADPMNFISVNTRDIRQNKTTEGREAIRRDVRFYAWFLDDDAIIEEQDAVVDIYGLAA